MVQHEQNVYIKNLNLNAKQRLKGLFCRGLADGVFMFLLYLINIGVLYVGSWFINIEILNKSMGRTYTVGDVVTIFCGVVIFMI